ncbi:MAG: hypothetical protein QG552_3548, partial [Thermodesulfobacteriota bacterium]|nr:hypothetical protein [Thermodesulfobacteriota bacterium]
VNQGNIMVFLGEPLGDVKAYLPCACNDDFHNPIPLFSRGQDRRFGTLPITAANLREHERKVNQGTGCYWMLDTGYWMLDAFSFQL